VDPLPSRPGLEYGVGDKWVLKGSSEALAPDCGEEEDDVEDVEERLFPGLIVLVKKKVVF
jgi:hypothetical protein